MSTLPASSSSAVLLISLLAEYCLSFTTANDRDAGTNATICVSLLGSKESTGRVSLPWEEELFERGMTDEFKVKDWQWVD